MSHRDLLAIDELLASSVVMVKGNPFRPFPQTFLACLWRVDKRKALLVLIRPTKLDFI